MDRHSRHLDFLDLLRGIAILAVFCFHALEPSFGFEHLPWSHGFRSFDVTRSFLLVLPCCLGWAGVAIFFAVSGFCIHLSFLRQPEASWGQFFRRRFFRIYPLYFLALVFFAWVWPQTRFAVGPSPTADDWWSHLFLVHNFNLRAFYGINPAFWSLAVEVQLYLLYPVWQMLARRLGWSGMLVVAGVVEFTLRACFTDIYTIYTDLPRLSWAVTSPLGFWFSWGLGAAVAEAWWHERPLPFARTPVWLWLALAVAVYFVHPLAAFSFPLFSVATCVVIGRFLSGRWSTEISRLHPSRLIQRVGVWSYSLYLIHQPITIALPVLIQRRAGHPLHPLALFAICLSSGAISIPLSALLNRWVEQPFTRLGYRRSARIPSPSVPTDLHEPAG